MNTIEVLKEAKKALELSLKEFAGLPHSLGYEITHKPKIQGALDVVNTKLTEMEELAQARKAFIQDKLLTLENIESELAAGGVLAAGGLVGKK